MHALSYLSSASRGVWLMLAGTTLAAVAAVAASSYRIFCERSHSHDEPEQDATRWLAARGHGA